MFARLSMPEDEDEVIELARSQVAETLPHLVFSEAKTRATFKRSLQTAEPTIFVVEDQRKVVGYLVAILVDYAMSDGHFAMQDVIYVRPDKRGTRAAARLIQLYDTWAENTGALEIYTGVSNGFQPDRTSRFLQHFGFSPVGGNLRRIPGSK